MTAAAPPKTFAPEPPATTYAPPAATIDPDHTKSWLQRMRPVLRAHRRLILGTVALAVVGQVLQMSAPRILMAAVDQALIERVHAIGPYAVALAALATARLGTGIVARYQLARIAAVLDYDLRVMIQRHLSRQSFSYFDQVQTGQLISRANADIRSIQMLLTYGPLVVVMFGGFLLALGLMARIHLGLTAVALIPFPMLYVAGKRMRRHMWPLAWLRQERMGDLSSTVEQNLAGAHVLRALVAERPEIRRLTRDAERLRWASVREAYVRARFQPIIESLPRASIALVILYGGWLASREEVTVGALIAFFAYAALLQWPMEVLGVMVMMAQRASASAARIFEILDYKPDITQRPNAIVLERPRGEVRFEAARFAYPGGPEIVRGVDLHVAAGETVALVGRTGCGKSTLTRLIPRFHDVTAGTVLVDGHDVRELTLESLRASVGIVLDEPFLFSATIRENIAYGRPDASVADVLAVAEAAGARAFIDELPDGIDTKVGERGYTLSGGQRQRLSIARTLLMNPPILVLDDATSAVDVRTEHEIHAALRRLLRDRTTLIVAHRLATISLADRVILLEGGRIVADGPHERLLREVPAYAEVLAQTEQESLARQRAEQAMAAQRPEAPAWASDLERPGSGGFPGDFPGAQR